MKKITENSTKRIGQYLTLKEARKGLVEKHHKDGWGSWFHLYSIYRECDGTYSIEQPKVAANAEFIEAVDGQSGRRFSRVKKHGEWMYTPKKKLQDNQCYRGYNIIFP